MTGVKINLPAGYTIDKNGKIKKGQNRKLSVSAKIAQKKSKRVRVVGGKKTS